MPRQKIDVIEDVKKKYVRMALESGKITSIARKAGISSVTLRKWMNEYEDEKASIEEKLCDILFSNCRYYKNNEEQIMLMKRAMLFPPSELAESLRAEFTTTEVAMDQMLIELFKAGIKNGEIFENVVDDLLSSYYCMMDGLFIRMFYYRDKDFESKMQGAWKIYWKGISAGRQFK